MHKLKRNNDIIRAVGYVTIQASHLEGSIEEIAISLSPVINRPENHQTYRVSDKIKWCKQGIRSLNAPELDSLDKSLDKALTLFEKRNKLIHGRIYFDYELPVILVPTKKNQRTSEIKADELYDLAETIYNLHIRIVSKNAFKILKALSNNKGITGTGVAITHL